MKKLLFIGFVLFNTIVSVNAQTYPLSSLKEGNCYGRVLSSINTINVGDIVEMPANNKHVFHNLKNNPSKFKLIRTQNASIQSYQAVKTGNESEFEHIRQNAAHDGSSYSQEHLGCYYFTIENPK